MRIDSPTKVAEKLLWSVKGGKGILENVLGLKKLLLEFKAEPQ